MEKDIIAAIQARDLGKVKSLVFIPDTVDKSKRSDTAKYRHFFTTGIKREIDKLAIRSPIYVYLQEQARKIGEPFPAGEDTTYSLGTGGRKKTRKSKKGGRRHKKTRRV